MKRLKNIIFIGTVTTMILAASMTTYAAVGQYREMKTAEPTASAILVDGNPVELEAYTIDSNNYFKLRDIAVLVMNSAKKFDVTWDGDRKAINLISNKAYTKVGGELALGDGKVKEAEMDSSTVYKDGQVISLKAYTINGNNYFKLRDLAKAFDIGVTWDGVANTVGIDTSTGYIDEEATEDNGDSAVKEPLPESNNLLEQEESEEL